MKYKLSFRLLSLLLAAVMCCMCFSACSDPVNVDETGAADIQNYPVTVNDVTINSKPSKAIVLGECLADVVLAIDAETQLTAVTEDCTQSDFEDLPKISTGDIDAVINASPDIVIASSLSDENKASLESACITYVVIEPASSRSDFERLYTQIGSIFEGASNGYNSALSVAQDIFTSLDDLSRIIPDNDNKITTACYIFDTESKCVTGEDFASVLMDYAGITNVFKGAKGSSYSIEDLSVADPDIIFCPVGYKDKITADKSFKSLTAVKNGAVYEIDKSYMIREGRSVIMSATTMAGCAYPSLLSDTTANVQPEVNKDETEAESSEAESAVSKDNSKEADEEDALKLGDSNDSVYSMQYRLSELGYLTVEFDGYFGEVTETALKAFQKANGLTETGVCGSVTLEVLNSENAVAAASETNSEDGESSQEESSTDSAAGSTEESSAADSFEESSGGETGDIDV